MKNKAFLTILSGVTLAVAALAVYSLKGENTTILKADENEYLLNINTFDDTVNNDVATTVNGNDIDFEYYNYVASGTSHILSQYGYIQNTTVISGIKTLTISLLEDANLTISYGWKSEEYVVDDIIMNQSKLTYDFEDERPSYFKITNNSENSVTISSISITYSCVKTKKPDIHKLNYELINEGAAYSVVGRNDNSYVNVVIPSEYRGKPVTTIGKNAFQTSNLVSVDIPSSVTTILSCAFHQSRSLKRVNLSEGLLSIGMYAFDSCDKLSTLIIPSSVTTINNYGVDGHFVICLPIATSKPASWATDWNEGRPVYWGYKETITEGDYTYALCEVGSSKNAIVLDFNEELTSFAPPSMVNGYRVKNIAQKMFSEEKHQNVINVTYPNGVTQVDSSAFKQHPTIETVLLPDSVTKICILAFSTCQKLTSINIPEGVYQICGSAFYYCSSLTSIFIPINVVTVDSNAFGLCNKLTIKCEASEQPEGWDANWNLSNRPVEWGCTE